jgi:hypothetical protein
MREYPKTENVFTRDDKTHKLNLWDFRIPEFNLINLWHVTEKIDGTNIRILSYFDENGVPQIEVRGRSDNANLPPGLAENIRSHFTDVDMLTYRASLGIDNDVTLCIYGEGFGAGIQKGGGYRPDKDIAIFDVTTTNSNGNTWWRGWSAVNYASDILNLDTVPYIGFITVSQMVHYLEDNPKTFWENGTAPMEGFIARTDPYLYRWDGSRLMFKLKVKDIT